MRITFLTFGSRGDVEPYVGLGVALRRAGHRVTVAAPEAFETLIRRAGLEPHLVGPDPRLLAENGGAPRWLRSSAAAGARRLRAASRARSGLGKTYSGYLEASRKADVVLYSVWLGPVARTIGRICGCLAVPAYLAPIHPTRAFPSPYIPVASNPGWNRLTHELALRLGRAALQGAPNAWGRQVAGSAAADAGLLPPVDEVCLYGFSRSLLPPPPDWPPGAVVTGPWLLDAPADWRPPEQLRRFLQKPGKVIFIGFGSMMDSRPEQLNRVVQVALGRLRCRAVLLAGAAGQLALPPSDRWCVVRDVSFDWLFPRMDVILHHGGAGTTAQAARAGKPSIAVPFFADQPFWGQLIHQAGAGPPPIKRRALTAKRLASRIEAALDDPQYAERAALLGAQVGAEKGASTAVRIVETVWEGRASLPGPGSIEIP